jgi:ATP-binding cassette, subfamily C, bacterial CydD
MTTHRLYPFDTVRSWLLLAVALGLLGIGAAIAQMLYLSEIVSGVFLAKADLSAVWPLLVLLLGASAVRAALNGARELVARHAAIRVKSTLRARLFAHLLQLGPAYSRGERTGELVTTAVEGIERLDAYVSQYLPQVALSVLVPLLIAVAILPVDGISTLLLLVTAPVIPLLMVLVGRYAEKRVQQQWSGLSLMSAHLLDVLQGLPTLVLFGRAEAESDRVARISARFRERTLQALRVAFLSGMVLEFMVAAAIGVVAVVLGVRLINGDITFQRAFFVLLLTPEFYRPLRDLGTHRHAGMEGKAALTRITEILDTPAPAASMPASESSKRPAGPLSITLNDVTYTYPGGDCPALDGVSFTLLPGTRTALVGRSGAGKSTLVSLLLQFASAPSGTITVNGLPLGEIPPALWREHVALVPQRPYLFAGTVRENLQLARPSATDEEIVRAAELAGAHAFIRELPRGYDSPVGERGARLSAGQIQRMAIARAFLKDAPLLILDEPTSHLDPESERLIRQALQTLMRGRTVLVVAHRLNTVLSTEQVVVLEHGHAVEVGTHAELAVAGGAYARLIRATREAEALV